MNLPVGVSPSDPEIPGPPERPIADAPASALVRGAASACRRSGWAWIEAALWAVAAASALVLLLVVVDRATFSAHQSRLLAESLSAAARARGAAEALPPEQVRPLPALVPPGPFLARLEIPRIALSAVVVDGVDAATLRRAVGRIPASSRPGEAGDVALAGHRDSHFRALGELEIGDSLILHSGGGEFRYAVESIRIVAPQQVDVLTPAAYPTLTLVTCFPFRYVGPAPQRYIVRAREVPGPKLSGTDLEVSPSPGPLPGR